MCQADTMRQRKKTGIEENISTIPVISVCRLRNHVFEIILSIFLVVCLMASL